MKISVLLADDSEIMRKAIVGILRDDPDVQLLAQASSFIQTMELTSRLHPQVVVMDLYMKDEKDVTPSQVKSSLRGSVLLAISLRNDDETKAMAESFGAVILLDKVNLAAELIPAIKLYANDLIEISAPDRITRVRRRFSDFDSQRAS
jgi:two-component system response regulator DevR